MNAGDDIFIHVVAWGLRRYEQAGRLFMDCDLSGRLSRLCGIHTAQLHRCRIPGLPRLRRAWFRHKARCFVLAGGTLLPTLKGTQELLADKHWTRSGRRRIALGFSVGPFQSPGHEDAVVELLNSMDYVAFRDDSSFEWAVAHKLKARFSRSFDLAVLLPQTLPQFNRSRGKERVLGISLLASEAQKNPGGLARDLEVASQIGAVVEKLAGKLNLKVIFFSLCLNSDSDDRVMARAFANACKASRLELFEHNSDPVRTFEKVRSCSHMVSMRLHGGIMAFTAAVPFLQLEYHPKCREFAATIGLSQPHRLDMEAFSTEVFSKKLEALVGFDSILSAMDLASAQERARSNFDLTAS